LGLAALLAPLTFVISGILSIDESLSTFSDPIIWIFASGFVLAAAFHKHGVGKRIIIIRILLSVIKILYIKGIIL
jgi:di/tricarboxylate transporter